MNINKQRNRLQALSLETTEIEIADLFNLCQEQYQYPRHMSRRQAVRRNNFSHSSKTNSSSTTNDTFYCQLKGLTNSNCCLQSV